MHVISKLLQDVNYEFDEYNFGAFSPSLETIQIQNEVSGIIDQPYGDGPLQLSPKGERIARKLWNESSDKERKLFSQVKDFLNEMRYWEVIAYSYSTYPETVLHSEIKPEFIRTRLIAAINLFKRHKISLSKAASIAGMSTEEFEKILLKRQIKPYELNKDMYEKSMKIFENIT